jgi:hypothetical protein
LPLRLPLSPPLRDICSKNACTSAHDAGTRLLEEDDDEEAEEEDDDDTAREGAALGAGP